MRSEVFISHWYNYRKINIKIKRLKLLVAVVFLINAILFDILLFNIKNYSSLVEVFHKNQIIYEKNNVIVYDKDNKVLKNLEFLDKHQILQIAFSKIIIEKNAVQMTIEINGNEDYIYYIKLFENNPSFIIKSIGSPYIQNDIYKFDILVEVKNE